MNTPPPKAPPSGEGGFQSTLIEGLAELTYHVERIADVLEAEGAKTSSVPPPAHDFIALGEELASGFGDGDGVPDLAAYAARFMREKFGGGS